MEEAYKAIPHRQTTFDPDISKIPTGDSEFLFMFFTIVDRAVVQRVETLQWILAGAHGTKPPDRYDQILNALRTAAVPEHLGEAHTLVVESIEDQRAFLEEWESYLTIPGMPQPEIGKRGMYSNRYIRSSTKKLYDAYLVLSNMYRKEEEQHNMNAFFDHLCALDFL